MKRIFALSLLAIIFNTAVAQVELSVQLGERLKGPYTGRLFVYTLKDTSKQFTDRSMAEEPAFYLNVKNWQPGRAISFRSGAKPSIRPLDSLAVGIYKLVAILDTNNKERGNSAPGNLYSRAEGLLRISAPGKGEGGVRLSDIFTQRPFRESPVAKEVKFRSALLTAFRKEDIFIKAAVILPGNYQRDTSRFYPVVFIIPGWGGTHQQGAMAGSQQLYGMGQGKDKIYVYLNPETQTPWGLHAFVDSRVNGPWGKALVEEFIPYLEKTYRVIHDPKQHFLTGQSSGGYGVVWLALHYPAYFGGTWATSPDPLDFSSFTGVDLYHDQNFYTDKNGKLRGINLVNGAFQQTLKEVRMAELFTGDGGQQQSFEAEFGMPDKNGRPKDLFDPQSGRIYREIVKEWQIYDLGLLVQKKWPAIKKAGVGRITVYAGGQDNYLLNESVLAFEKKVKAAGADIRIVILPEANHFTVRSAVLTAGIQSEIDQLID